MGALMGLIGMQAANVLSVAGECRPPPHPCERLSCVANMPPHPLGWPGVVVTLWCVNLVLHKHSTECLAEGKH